MSKPADIKTWHAEFTLHKDIVTPLNDFIDWSYSYPSPPTMSCFEIEGTDNWLVEIFTDFEPSADVSENIRQHLESLISQPLAALSFTGIKEQDWVSESQKQHTPIKIGRFLCYGSHNIDLSKYTDSHTISIEMDAGQAFGTGGHETTGGCMQVLDELAETISPTNILDIGTGTGLLAIAAQKLWPVPTLATDNDPIAIKVTRENIAKNNIAEVGLNQPNGISLLEAHGFDHDHFKQTQKFDLVLANILANPLIALAPKIRHYTTNECNIVLSGILNNQANSVIKAYEKQGFNFTSQLTIKEWSVLIFS